jgi:Ca2+-binding EF-hand superfamily protein
MAMLHSSGKQGLPPPKGTDIFLVGDTNGDGVLSASEITALTGGTEEGTVNSINVEDALSSYDANQDGGLSGEELLEMPHNNGFAPPDMTMGETGESAMKPPPPSSEQALAAYEQNKGEDLTTQLFELLQNSDAQGGHASIDVTS